MYNRCTENLCTDFLKVDVLLKNWSFIFPIKQSSEIVSNHSLENDGNELKSTMGTYTLMIWIDIL